MDSRRSAFRIAPLLLLSFATAFAQEPKPAPKYPIVDGHLHFLSFVQETDGMAKFFKAMDDTGVTESVVIGMSVVKTWDERDSKRPAYYLDNDSRTYWYSATDFLVARAILDLPKEQQARLHPFICGINSADRNAVDHVERMLALYPNFWQGIGEVFLRHDDLTALTYGDAPRATSDAFSRLLDLGAARDLPVLVHSDIGPAWLEKPDFLDEIEIGDSHASQDARDLGARGHQPPHRHPQSHRHSAPHAGAVPQSHHRPFVGDLRSGDRAGRSVGPEMGEPDRRVSRAAS